MQTTTSLCNTCYAEIPAFADPFNEVATTLYKVCPVHGIQRAPLEYSREFYAKNNTYERKNHYPVLIINVTDRCNIKCKHCYYPIKNQWDLSMEEFKYIVNHFKNDFSTFIISGGDPTCWEHYFTAADWCKSEGIKLSQLTNGVRFAEPEFMDKVINNFGHKIPDQADFLCAEMSVHPANITSPEIREKQLSVLQTLREKNTRLSCIMINIDPEHASMWEVEKLMTEVVEFMQEWRDVTLTFRIRPICFGWASEQKPTLFLSQLVHALSKVAKKKGYLMQASHKKDIDNIYNQNFELDGIDVVTVCAAPSVENIDIGYLNRGPWMLANDGIAYSVPHALLINEGIDKGWYRGQRIEDGNIAG